MRKLAFYRYFLGFRLDAADRRVLAAASERAAQGGRRVPDELKHLTLCVVREVRERDRFITRLVESALAGRALASVPIPLGEVRGGPRGALVRTIGRQDAIQDFYRELVRLLAARGIEPLHRKSGLHPHVTLGHDACEFESFRVLLEWIPTELLLIESEVGRTKHNVLRRWPLLSPRQGALPFARAEPARLRLPAS